MESGAKTVIVLMIVFAVLSAVTCVSRVVVTYEYKRDVSGFLMLADDASVASLKLQYLEQYRDAVREHLDPDGNAAYIFKTPQTATRTQYAILDSLIERVQEVTNLDPQSLEYQQAMAQVTGQEFAGTIEVTNSLFAEAWLRDNFVRFVFGSWETPTVFLVLAVIALFVLMAVM